MPNRLIFALTRIQTRVMTHMKQELQKAGAAFSPGQIGILLVLENVGQTSMGDLSQTLEIDNAAITRLVDKLEKQQLVERRINPDDRRRIQIAPTATGLEKARIVKQIAQATNRKITEGFTQEEIATYVRMNQAIIAKFSECPSRNG